MKTIHENLDDEAKEKLYEASKKWMITICQKRKKISVAA